MYNYQFLSKSFLLVFVRIKKLIIFEDIVLMKNFYKVIFLLGVFVVLFQSCTTTSIVASNVDVGMNGEQVRMAAGAPWAKNKCKDSDGSVKEEWIYRETTWDDGGWSWDRTMFNTHVIFKGNKVEAIFKDSEEIFKTKVFIPSQKTQVNIQQNIMY